MNRSPRPNLDAHARLPLASLNRLSWLGLLLVCAGAALAAPSRYEQANLTSDVPNTAATTDGHLIGAWGIATSASGPWWVNSTLGGVSIVYDGSGKPFPTANPLVVNVPAPPGMTIPSVPTGLVSYAGTGFTVGPNQPARFIFATRTGTVSGWNPQANPQNAIIKVDHSADSDYTGIALGHHAGAEVLFVADFKSNEVELLDTSFQPVELEDGAFEDRRVPDDFSVFNVQVIADNVYVTYAAKNAISATGGGPGQGYVTVFDSDGHLLHRLRHGHWMNSPWAVVRAPDDFGKFSGDILVGMFGDGAIVAFDPRHGNFRGVLRGTRDNPLTLGKGLWALAFGNGATAGPANHLYFGADIIVNGQIHGLFGAIAPSLRNDENDDDNEDRQGNQGNNDDDNAGDNDSNNGGSGQG